jgi:hypothetical protein
MVSRNYPVPSLRKILPTDHKYYTVVIVVIMKEVLDNRRVCVPPITDSYSNHRRSRIGRQIAFLLSRELWRLVTLRSCVNSFICQTLLFK